MTTATAPSEIVLQVPLDGFGQQSNVDFTDTTFFTRASGSAQVSLPSPADVLAHHERSAQRHLRLAVFQELSLVVRFGKPPRVHLLDALTMRALRQAFPQGEVPVPEIFGWRVEKGINFIYQNLVPGTRLRVTWPGLSDSDKKSICKCLGSIQTCLRQLRPDTGDTCIGTLFSLVLVLLRRGLMSSLPTQPLPPHLQNHVFVDYFAAPSLVSITGGEVHDRFSRPDYGHVKPAGPSATVKAFND